ncbi:glycerol-3-phosphate O-acyltransferase 3/4 [Nematocida parisii]|uniref:1-acyl-sn-glycerol-3-phosphate acyltransferase zeta n=1 Tax=Nematocida parisii (strain ERTm3) TaxID=935791 RepID=I3EHV0_NEMP3|nr:1-acyl-sn-glycerol-3-phosphate acyltransferase zeta [Nematocida parisii ERTm1]EIJ88797.1 1-acyl-sn-glycerol-3-phosphate acyltransferase zeta [Nematocida parisii ERTm3]KAI5143028.1 glycerol-3-phosphate O-acyltransferase 3/4 [Nematocida parisii]EIJ92705.1 1-acyl-sn-glycerol-3-phosphate acyltransferase zeta [Nematocida parisii ERTm1]KAI5153743.1 glycerol-3-phosphate O-acyltransferase 3/4 [Nematocida parisii]KAI5156144.1 glycerol-3-phosphate O-acyltransferase 3/4 [Nematocida parisii]|eukprot:XP_013060223.1 1-acyl-sn-glycerol-3-phosphate acyltransferase zeta [Nematocida parisii ERTm1]
MKNPENFHPSVSKETRPLPILRDILYCTALAGKALIQDEFSSCFQQKETKAEFTVSYGWSMFCRYSLILPLRLPATLVILLFYSTLIILSRVVLRGIGSNLLLKLACKGLLWAMGVQVKHYGNKKKPDYPHVYIANHTTYMDYIILSSHRFAHSVIAQRQDGFMSMLLKLVSGSVQFERKIKANRNEVKEEIRKLAQNASIIVFPEGTCVNNEYTVMFQKGAFELGVPVCPVAIKYNKSLGDPYWNTKKQSFTKYFIYLITRWRTEVSVWWLPPMKAEENESAAEFATRVKKLISEKAGLKNLVWNGYLKHCKSPEEMKEIKRWGDQLTPTLLPEAARKSSIDG